MKYPQPWQMSLHLRSSISEPQLAQVRMSWFGSGFGGGGGASRGCGCIGEKDRAPGARLASVHGRR